MSIDTLDLEFSSNQITAITGANGSGKSSLINAIAFAITGYRQGESYKDYVKTGYEKAKIKLDATFNGYPLVYDIDIYNSKKHPQPTNKVVTYNGKTYINSDYSQFISENKIEELESLMFMFQGSHSIIESRPAERAALLKKLFKFEFPEIVDKLRSRQEQKKLEIVEYNTLLKELNSKIYEKLPLLRETAPVNIKNWEGRVNEINSNLSLIGDTNENEIKECEDEIIEIQKILNNTTTKRKEDEASLSKAKYYLKEIEASISSTNIDTLNKELDNLREEQSNHEKEFASQQSKYTELKSSLDVLYYKEKELQEQYEISKTGICHACGQPIEESHLEHLKYQIEKTQGDILEKKEKIKQLGFDPRDAKSKEIRKKLQFTEDLIKKYNNDIKTKETILVRINDLSDLILERGNSILQLESKVKSLAEKKATLSEMEGLIKEKNNLIQEREDILNKLQTSRDNTIKNEERRASNKRLEKEKATRDSRILEITNKINEISLELVRIKKETDIFEKEFPNYIVLQACQHLEEVINEIVQRVFPYCRISLKLSKGGVNFFYTPEDSDGEWVTVSMASGAQKMLITLSYFIALAKLSGMSCIFLDEIDAYCSAESSKIIYEFIAKINLFNQLFFVTHRPASVDVVKETNPNVKVYIVHKGEYEEG